MIGLKYVKLDWKLMEVLFDVCLVTAIFEVLTVIMFLKISVLWDLVEFCWGYSCRIA